MDLDKTILNLKTVNSFFKKTTDLPRYEEFCKQIEIIYSKIRAHRKKLPRENLKSLMYASGTFKKRQNSKLNYLNKLDGKNLELLPLPFKSSKVLSPYPITCHICHSQFQEVHHHYYSLCPPCADLNFEQRHVIADLSSKVSLVTGGRVKIGFEIAKKLLRCGSKVIVTTRFPEDCLRRFEIVKDYNSWKENLIIVYLDLINFHQVLQFVKWVEKNFSRLDILILNAAQTVSKEKIFYQSVMQDYEKTDHVIEYNSRSNLYLESSKALAFNSLTFDSQPNHMLLGSLPVMELENNEDHSKNQELQMMNLELDEDHQIKEYRVNNTWNERLDNFNMKDFLSILAINLFSPACLVQLLTPLLKKPSSVKTEETKEDYSFVILVSAVEGMFKINTKSSGHPHTNAAKAGLNMFTRTSGADYKSRFNILINSVDTGFITVETLNSTNFVPPLDNKDGMARVLHPIFECINKNNVIYGSMLKNYKQVDF